MSVHRSLKSTGKLKRHRSVLTRTERLDALKNEERWQDGDSVYGLPKVRVIRVKRKKIKKEETADEAALVGEGAAGEAAAGEAAPKTEGSDKEA